jgi:aminopeptidase
MTDPRVVKLAALLVDYSVGLKKRQWLALSGLPEAAPLIREVYRAALRRGAFVELLIGLEGLNEIFFAEADDEQLRHVSPTRLLRTRRVDAQVGILGESNTRALTGADPKHQAVFAAAQKRWRRIF